MVNKCANPVCRTAFRLLESGDLYALEQKTVDTQFFWLCPACASRFVLHLNAWGGVVLSLRGEQEEDDLQLSDVSLHRVAHAVLNTQKRQQREGPGCTSSNPGASHSSLRLHSF
jgi:hypothetical protein